MFDLNTFEGLKIGLASPEQIRSLSSGEVKKPETINYRTLKPEKDGLFCEKIFGPTRDWECYCGKYKRIRFKGIICERCGVEVTRSKVRRERMGHVELAAPVAHIWYFKGAPSRMGYLLDISPRDLEKIIYFAAYIIVSVDKERRQKDLPVLKEEIDNELATLEKSRDEGLEKLQKEREEQLAKLAETYEGKKIPAKETKKVEDEMKKSTKSVTDTFNRRIDLLKNTYNLLTQLNPKQLIADEMLYQELKDRYSDYFKGGMGAEALRDLLSTIHMENERETLRGEVKTANGQKKLRAVKRLKVVSSFLGSKNRPEWMIFEAIPVIPPDLRPMVQLDGGRFATSDLNDLYRRVINRNNRLHRLLELGAPDIIINNEKRMLQEAVDAVFDNSRRNRPVTGPGNRPLKSLSDMIKGKQGRFRQNLLGKRVDYSGRSVIVVGPHLKLHQCGLPKQMALELFKPFVMKRLVDLGHVQNIKTAKRMVERARPLVWDVLEEVIKEHAVLLNRAPTLHRLGIQAFEPILVEGKAIQIHPMVCAAFNADFDGDQMAVHLPLSLEAQAEARILMLSVNNILSPASGRPLATPTQDMVIGINYLTSSWPEKLGEGSRYSSPDQAILAHDNGVVDLQAVVNIRMNGEMVETTIGRVIFNNSLPDGYRYINEEVSKKMLANIVTDCCEKYDNVEVAEILDEVKNLGFKYASKAGLTVGITDCAVPPDKWQILEEPERTVDLLQDQYRKGIITDDERHQRVVEIWNRATEEVTAAMEKNFQRSNPIFMMAYSGARGDIRQIRQLAGMRGLVTNPKGDIIDRPIKANFREGLSVLEYFISTHGARKGLADTALRTADSGYLTRRLVDVAQEVITREDHCGTEEGVTMKAKLPDGEVNRSMYARTVAENIVDPKTGEVLLEKGNIIGNGELVKIAESDLEEVNVRSVLVCRTQHGVCRECYGASLSHGRLTDIGDAVGIIAAQSIGEPGTQLTMRTFHTGGVVGEDITHGLPRVVELFEARKPKGQAILAEIAGKVEIVDTEKHRKITIIGGDGKEKLYQVSRRARLAVADGGYVEAGDQLTHGSINPHDLLKIKGEQAVQLYLVKEVQEVYKSQGVEINDKHIELIIRQMLKRVIVADQGDTEFLPGQLVDRTLVEKENARVKAEGGVEAAVKENLMGITKASLATDSFLSAASFQETTRVLTEAAISGKVDPLLGLKENVIIGKLIPAATGMRRYRNIGLRFLQGEKEAGYDDLAAEGGSFQDVADGGWIEVPAKV